MKKGSDAPAGFGERLVQLRRARGLSQAVLADRIGSSAVQYRRYEAGTSQPTLDVIRAMAEVLRVRADALIFGEEARGPDEDLRLLFEAVGRLDAEAKKVVKVVIEGLIARHEAKSAKPERRGRPRKGGSSS